MLKGEMHSSSFFSLFSSPLLIIYQRGWLSLPTKFIFCICVLCLIFLEMAHSNPLFSSLDMLYPWAFFQFLGTPVSFLTWARPDPSAGIVSIFLFKCQHPVMTLMTHLSKTGPSAVVVSLCLRNLFILFVVLPWFILFALLTKLFCFTILSPALSLVLEHGRYLVDNYWIHGWLMYQL